MKIKVKKSKIQGKGVFASQNIKKGEIICKMKGKKISIKKLKKLYESGKEREGDPLQISLNKYLDLEKPYVYINHSCNPNSAIIKTKTLIALKNIKKDEEITYDYSLVSSDPKDGWGEDYEDWFIFCKCKNKNCRKIIKEFQHLPKSIKNKALKEKRVPNFIVKKFR